jgi:dihydrofolate reductase
VRKLIVSEFVTLVVSRTLERPTWRNTTIIRDNVIESVRALKAQPGKSIVTDGSSQLVHALLAHDLVDELHLLVYPLTLGSGKRVLPEGVHTTFGLKSAKAYPTGVVGLHYVKE